jgi:uncharacterized protein (DUF1015 family)
VRIHAFHALRPAAGRAAAVASPPYDVVSREEAARLIADNPSSFLRVVRSDAELPADVEAYDARVYARARENFEQLLADGALVREGRPALYVYRLVREGRAQAGVTTCVHVDDYEAGIIKKHETTRPDKEDDRTRHILALGAHAEPVLLAYRDRPEIDRLISAATAAAPLFDFSAADGVRHTVWPVADPAAYADAFSAVPCAYVADGHHRTASAWRAARQGAGAGDGERGWLPAVLFPASALRILPYNRVLSDLGGQSEGAVLAELRALGRLSPAASPTPPRSGTFAFYLARRWHLLELPLDSIDRGDPVRSLDAALLQDRVLGPVLGIVDQRTDKRIDFVGGARGTRALESLVDAGAAAMAISLFPTTVEQLMAVSDAGRSMPPKSTWFEPKLASGLFVHSLE